jgi:phage repressor protein C with HTH and peptisase S24 domain
MSPSQYPHASAHLQFGYSLVHSKDAMAGKTIQQVVAELLVATGCTQTELAEKLHVSQPQISRWLKGAEARQQNLGSILALARRYGIIHSMSEIEHIRGGVEVVGYVGAGGAVVFSEGQVPFEKVESPPNSTPTMVALRVKGDSMSPMIGDGWLVYYDRHDLGSEIAAGKPYVVGLMDGRVLIKKLVHGRRKGCYDLYSVNADPILDQAVEWIARVKAIIP